MMRRYLGLTVVGTLLAACNAAGPSATGPGSPAPSSAASAGAVPSTPGQDTAPLPSGSPTASPATPAPVGPSVDPSGAIRRFDVPQAKSLLFTMNDASGLTMLLAAATDQGPRHDVTFGAGPGSAGSSYRALALDGQGTPCAVSPRLRGQDTASRALLQAAPSAVGSKKTFWINTGDFTTAGDRQQTCTLKIVTPDLYIYLDDAANAQAATNLQALADVFGAIKPKDEAAYGAPPGAGPDGETRASLVISPAVNNFGAAPGHEGYFWARDLISTQDHANGARAVFVADDYFHYPDVVVDGVLAHEYQHLINFVRKTAANGGKALSEDNWLDEGMAVYAQQVCGYGLPAGDRNAAHDVMVFESQQADYGLTDWTGNPAPAFGQSYLFVRYMVDRYGQGLLKEIIDNPQTGTTGLDTVLGKHGSSFAGTFLDWAIANYRNDPGTPYGYAGLDLAANVNGIQLPGFQPKGVTGTQTASLRPWGSQAYRFSGGGPWGVSVGGSATTRVLGAAW